MHNELRALLRTASGESSFIVAVNIDIREFSTFFSDSSQAAAFLGSAYTRILDSYFTDVAFLSLRATVLSSHRPSPAKHCLLLFKASCRSRCDLSRTSHRSAKTIP
jgi:hypothetical protein